MDGSDSYELVQEDPLTMTAGTYSHPGSAAATMTSRARSSASARSRNLNSDAAGGIADMADNILEIRHLSKSFGTHEVLRDIDFDVKKAT